MADADDIVDKLDEVVDYLKIIAIKVDQLTGNCSLDDLRDSIDAVRGGTGYDLTDIHNVLMSIDIKTE